MFNLNKLVRQNIIELQPYSSAREEFPEREGVFLDANENPFGELNRYPDPFQKELKNELSRINEISTKNIFIANGSDEAIDLSFRIFCNPGRDKALTFLPSYGMYQIAAGINDVELVEIPLNLAFQIDFELLEEHLKEESIKLIILCSPNNPTGNILENIEWILEKFNGIVLIDEAYIDFSDSPSFIEKIIKYPNLLVVQTLSKAWGLAAVRIGAAYANSEIISFFNKVKAPYNVSGLNQAAALLALRNKDVFESRKKMILQQKSWLEQELTGLPIIKRIYPSTANFLLVETVNANLIHQALQSKGIVVRNRNKEVENCLRITVGSAEENQQLIEALKNIRI